MSAMRGPGYDVLVVGAGHAAVEAGLAAARLGRRVAMLTISTRHVAEMPCNPAIGGVGKGQLVREIDALGGEMGRAIDETGLQFRMLNTGKGPAVRSPRAQADKEAYRARMAATLSTEPNLSLLSGRVEHIHVAGGCVSGVGLTNGDRISAPTIILTTGTFLCGLLHVGERWWNGGRTGEPAARRLSASLTALGVSLGRLKTGTPARLASDSIRWDIVEEQRGDEPPEPFSYSTQLLEVDQLPCHVTNTNKRTHEIIKAGLGRSPLFSGRINGTGPRYCPSIEDKVVRFGDRDSHRIILEPETRRGDVTYLNGLSTSLPFDVQVELIRSISGLERARVLRPGYAVEYDHADPTQLRPSLESKLVRGLFLAGQVNGTSGYEEAAAQGLMAGINAHRLLAQREPVVLGRADAYIGVLIDDLVTKGVDEPYRMFTSRAEHRLLLRADNADLRLTEIGHDIGLASDEALRRMRTRRQQSQDEHDRLERTTVSPSRANGLLAARGSTPLTQATTAGRLLSRPELSYADILELCPPGVPVPLDVARHVETKVKYSGYIERERARVRQVERHDGVRLPESLDYEVVHGLSTEARQKLSRIRPRTLGQAGRVQGISPSDVAVLLIYLKSVERSE